LFASADRFLYEMSLIPHYSQRLNAMYYIRKVRVTRLLLFLIDSLLFGHIVLLEAIYSLHRTPVSHTALLATSQCHVLHQEGEGYETTSFSRSIHYYLGILCYWRLFILSVKLLSLNPHYSQRLNAMYYIRKVRVVRDFFLIDLLLFGHIVLLEVSFSLHHTSVSYTALLTTLNALYYILKVRGYFISFF
jgi:hypothetical protein